MTDVSFQLPARRLTLGLIRATAERVGLTVRTVVTPARRGFPEQTYTSFWRFPEGRPVVGWIEPSDRPLCTRRGARRAGTLEDLAQHMSHIPGFTGALKREVRGG